MTGAPAFRTDGIGIEESLDQETEPIEKPATIPAAARKFADHFTGEEPSVERRWTRSSGGVDSRARSGEIDGELFQFTGIYRKGWSYKAM